MATLHFWAELYINWCLAEYHAAEEEAAESLAETPERPNEEIQEADSTISTKVTASQKRVFSDTTGLKHIKGRPRGLRNSSA